MSKSIIYKVSIYDSKESLRDNRMIGYQTHQGTPTYGNLEQLKADVRQMVKDAGLDCKNFRLYWKDDVGDKIRIVNCNDFYQAIRFIFLEKPESSVAHLFVTAKERSF